eukprot:symbB.v1.2.027772.t1/scaffold2874.1/size68342/4
MKGQVLEGSQTLGSYIKEASTVHVQSNISKALLLQQLAGLLNGRCLSVTELGDLYCYRYGAPVTRALELLGRRSTLKDFLKDNLEHFSLHAGSVKQREASNNSTVRTTTFGALNQRYLDLDSEITSCKSIEEAEACFELAIQSAAGGSYGIKRVIRGGSLGRGTAFVGNADAEALLLLDGTSPMDRATWLPPLLTEMASTLRKDMTGKADVVDDTIHLSFPGSLVVLSFDAVSGSFALAAERKARLFAKMSPATKVTMRLLKWWRNQQNWSNDQLRPCDLVLEELVSSTANTSPEDQADAVAAVLGALESMEKQAYEESSSPRGYFDNHQLIQLAAQSAGKLIDDDSMTAHDSSVRQQWSQRHVAPILGLPMRGKSHTARELKRYIQFFHGSRAEIFNVMEYQGRGGDEKFFEDLHSFFDASNSSSSADPYGFDQTGALQGTGGFAIILSSDTVASTQSMWSAHTKWHRRWMAKKLEDELQAEVCFIQITVDDPKGDKYLADLAAFRGMDLKESQELISHYQMDGSEDSAPFIHMMNYTKKMVVNKMMRSFVGSSVCHFLSNLHPFEHKIFLARHGESEFNVDMRIGGDSGLSPRGEEFARRTAEFAKYVVCGEANDLVCVTLTEHDVCQLHEHLVQLCGCLVTCDSWKGFGDKSGAEVNRYMRLKRLQVGWGNDFEDAPKNMDDLRHRLEGAKVATLVLVDGDTSNAGQVPGRLWTSSLRRTIETAQFIEHPILTGPDGKPYFQMRGQQFRNMDEVYAGEYDGLTEEEIRRKAPNVIEDRKRDKLGFRYPRGESYYDVIARLESVMSHLERIQQPIMIISHQAVLRMMYGWLMHINREDAIETQVPQHMIVKITFDGLGGPPVERRYPLGPMEMVDDGQGNLV